MNLRSMTLLSASLLLFGGHDGALGLLQAVLGFQLLSLALLLVVLLETEAASAEEARL